MPTLPFFVCVPPIALVLSSSSVLALPDALSVLSVLPPLSSPASPCAAAEPGDICPPPRPPFASPVSHIKDVLREAEHVENDVAASSVSDRQDGQKATHRPCPGFPSGLTYSLRHADLLQTLHVGHHQCLELSWSCQPLLIHQQKFCIHHFAQNAYDRQSPLSLVM